MNRVFVLMSSNYAPAQNLQACLSLLRNACHLISVSSVYETPPVGTEYADPFLDAVVELETDLDPVAFRQTVLGNIEETLGRRRNQPPPIKIPIDLDILLWNDDSFDFGDKPWHVPDHGIINHIHLALPLAELAPHKRHPETGQSFQEIANKLAQAEITLRKEIILDTTA